MSKAVDVYLQKTKIRQYVGRLKKQKRGFVFEYDESYRYSDNPIPFGPDLPIDKQKHSSLKLFPSFEDRIPSRENPAYGEYCQSVGISPSEIDSFVLLSKLGRKGPSSFILAPAPEDSGFLKEEFKKLRKDLHLSIREFSKLFDISSAAVYRIENNKSSGKDILKQIRLYFDSPQMALEKIKHTGHKINDQKRQFVEEFFKRKLLLIGRKKSLSPFTVQKKDISKCSPKQATTLIEQLLLLECSTYNIPQNSVHVSDNISATDGGQDGLVEWTKGPTKTAYFPTPYNCFQIKAKQMSPGECKKEILEKSGELKPAVKNVIKKKGAYILCSTHGVAGININHRESLIKEAIKEKASLPEKNKDIEIKFYDANRIANWLNCFPPVAIWFLKEIYGRNISSWVLWQEWGQMENYRSDFVSHSELDKKREAIKDILSRPGGVVHLTGASGLGKTRLAWEAFHPVYQDSEYLNQQSNLIDRSNSSKEVDDSCKDKDLSLLVLYSSAKNIKEFDIRELKDFRAILVIDDCSLEEATIFHKIATQEDSNLSLLTIGHEETEKVGEFRRIWKNVSEIKGPLIKLEPDKEIVKKMLQVSQNIINKHIEPKYLELTSGFPLMAELLKDVGPVDLLKDDIPTIRNKMLWGRQEPDKKGEKVIKACSLFDTICFSDEKREIISSSVNRGEEEVKYIAEKIYKLDYETFYEKIQFFKKRKIIQQYGRFIQVRPKPLAVWLAGELVESTPPESVTKWLSEMRIPQEPYKLSSLEQKIYSNQEKKDLKHWETEQSMLNGLRESFCKQLSYLESFSDAQSLVEQLCGKDSLFGNEKILNTEWGSLCFAYLADLNPTVTLETLKKVFGNKNTEELKSIFIRQFPDALRWTNIPTAILSTLQKLAVRKELYPQSARLLLKFAEAEEDSNWNPNATNVFIDHFQLLLSGTEASPNMKFQIIDEIKKSQSEKQKEIAIKALDQALTTEGFISHYPDVMQTRSGKVFKEWQPKTYGEMWDYFRRALGYLIEFTTKEKNQPIQEKARETIASKLNSLLDVELYDDVERAIKAVVDVHGAHWPSVTGHLLSFLRYASKKNKKESIKRIEKMLKILQPKEDINGRIKFYITECPWAYVYNKLEGEKNSEYDKQFKQLLKDFKTQLENGSKKDVIPSLKILFHGEQRNTLLFAGELAKSLKNPSQFIFQILSDIKKWKKDKDFNPSFLSGFLSGLNKTDSKSTQQILDQMAIKLPDLIIPACHNMNLQDQDIIRLVKVIEQNRTDLDLNGLRMLSTGQKCQFVTPEIMKKIITILTGKSVEFSWAALQIYFYYVYDFSYEKKQKLLSALYNLLTRKDLLSVEKDSIHMGNIDDYHYKQVVDDILESEYGKQFSEKFISQIFNSKNSLFNFSISHSTIRECFGEILQKFPDMVCFKILENINNRKVDYIFKNEASIGRVFIGYKPGPLEVLTEKQLKEWCKRAPDNIPSFFAKNINLFSYDKNKGFYLWSSFARFLLDEYGTQTKLTDALSTNLHNFTWSGSLLNYFEKVKKTLEELKDHKHKNVRDFTESELSRLDESIENEKQREKEQDEFGIL